MSKLSEKGFSAVEVILILIIVVLIGAVGYLVYKDHHKTKVHSIVKNSSVANTKSTTVNTDTNPSSQTYYLDNKEVSYMLPSGWQLSNPPSNLQPPCGQTVTSTLNKCTSQAILTLSAEGFTNPDQFYVNIATFPVANNTTPTVFFNEAGIGNSSAPDNSSNLVINGNAAYTATTTADPSTGEFILYYAITKDQTGVLLSCDFFKGNHYSFNTTNNYFGYESDVNTIAKSISIN